MGARHLDGASLQVHRGGAAAVAAAHHRFAVAVHRLAHAAAEDHAGSVLAADYATGAGRDLCEDAMGIFAGGGDVGIVVDGDGAAHPHVPAVLIDLCRGLVDVDAVKAVQQHTAAAEGLGDNSDSAVAGGADVRLSLCGHRHQPGLVATRWRGIVGVGRELVHRHLVVFVDDRQTPAAADRLGEDAKGIDPRRFDLATAVQQRVDGATDIVRAAPVLRQRWRHGAGRQALRGGVEQLGDGVLRLPGDGDDAATAADRLGDHADAMVTKAVDRGRVVRIGGAAFAGGNVSIVARATEAQGHRVAEPRIGDRRTRHAAAAADRLGEDAERHVAMGFDVTPRIVSNSRQATIAALAARSTDRDRRFNEAAV